MSEESKCSWVSRTLYKWRCPRPIWGGGDEEEEFCLFHSENYEAKKNEFKAEINAVLRGEPGELFLEGKRDHIRITKREEESLPLYDFLGFRFPEGCTNFNGHEFESPVSFEETRFSDDAGFDEATFSGHAGFDEATFSGYAGFEGATFKGDARFVGARFSG